MMRMRMMRSKDCLLFGVYIDDEDEDEDDEVKRLFVIVVVVVVSENSF